MNWTFELMSHNCTCHAEMVLTLIANDMAENPPTYSTIGLISFKLRALMCRVREHKLGSNILETWTFHFFYWNYVFQNWLHHFENQFSFIKVTQVKGSLKLLVWPSEVWREKLTNQKSKHGALKKDFQEDRVRDWTSIKFVYRKGRRFLTIQSWIFHHDLPLALALHCEYTEYTPLWLINYNGQLFKGRSERALCSLALFGINS